MASFAVAVFVVVDNDKEEEEEEKEEVIWRLQHRCCFSDQYDSEDHLDPTQYPPTETLSLVLVLVVVVLLLLLIQLIRRKPVILDVTIFVDCDRAAFSDDSE